MIISQGVIMPAGLTIFTIPIIFCEHGEVSQVGAEISLLWLAKERRFGNS
jgi:hypothetical protein